MDKKEEAAGPPALPPGAAPTATGAPDAPLLGAVRDRDASRVRAALLKEGRDANAADPTDGDTTPLLHAARTGHAGSSDSPWRRYDDA